MICRKLKAIIKWFTTSREQAYIDFIDRHIKSENKKLFRRNIGTKPNDFGMDFDND